MAEKALALKAPHGFLAWKGKKTAVASPVLLPAGEPLMVVTEGEPFSEGFGVAVLGKAAQMTLDEFDRKEWAERHLVRPEERRMWWPEAETLHVHRLESWEPFAEPQVVEIADGRAEIKRYEPPTERERELVERSAKLPKTITLTPKAVSLTGSLLYGERAAKDADFVVVGAEWRPDEDRFVVPLTPTFKEELERALAAVYEIDRKKFQFISEGQGATFDHLPLYQFALVRMPRLQVEHVSGGKSDFAAPTCIKEMKSMPYTIDDPPEQIRDLPHAAQVLWIEAFNGAYERYDDDDIARKIAWVVVKGQYAKDEEGEWAKKAAVTKTEDGQEYTADAYLYVPDPEKPSTWKVRIEDSPGKVTRGQLGASAAALGPGFRGRRVKMPSDDRRKTAKKLIAEYRKLDVPDEEIPRYLWRIAEMKAPEEKAIESEKAVGHPVCEDCEQRFKGIGEKQPEGLTEDYQGLHIQKPHGGQIKRKTKKAVVMAEKIQEAAPKPAAVPAPEPAAAPKKPFLKPVMEMPKLPAGPILPPEVRFREGEEGVGEGEKAGRRLAGAKVNLLKEIRDGFEGILEKLKELVGWGEYADLKPPTFDDLFKGDAAAGAAFKELMDEGLLFGEKPSFAVKTVDGEPWLFTWSTNAFEDRQEEIFSTKGLEDFAARAFRKEHKGYFDFWHIPDSEFARKKWIAVPGRYLAEAGPFLKDEKGARAFFVLTNYPQGHPDIAPEGWGCSPQFRYLPEEKEKGVFENFDITRTSVLPRFAAANIWTGEPEVMTMAITEQQANAGRAFFGDDLFDQIVEKGEAKTKEREEAGTAFKDVQETETGEKQVAKFIAALRDVAKEVDDEEIQKQLQGVADGLSKANMEERGGVARAIAGKLKGDQKERLREIADAMVEGEDYPEPTEEAPKEKGIEFPFDLKQVAEAVANELKALYEVDMAPLVEGLTATAVRLAAVEERLEKMQSEQAMKAETESPRWVLSMTPRASGAAETEVKEGDPLIDMKPQETLEQGGGKFVNAVFSAPK